MAKRVLQQYFEISRSVPGNRQAARLEAKEPGRALKTAVPITPERETKFIPAKAPVLKTISDFFTDNIFKWLKDVFYHERYTYPAKINGLPEKMSNATGKAGPIVIGLAADWANDTVQCEFVGKKIGEADPDYTIHIGDTYYSGEPSELEDCFGSTGLPGLWARGRKGSFLLAGNHEMYSNGEAYYKMISSPGYQLGIDGKGHEPVFCLETDHWCILGLDTGYDSLTREWLIISGTNKELSLPTQVVEWLENILATRKNKGIIVLTHHQYISAFKGEDEFINPAAQLEKLLPGKEIIWIWGHEHRFSMYGKFKYSPAHITAFGRCIGNGAMPDEHSDRRSLNKDLAARRNFILRDERIADRFPYSTDPAYSMKYLDIGYNGYAILTLDGTTAQIDYHAAYIGDNRLVHKLGDGIPKEGVDQTVFTERWHVEAGGKLKLVDAKEPAKGRLSFFGEKGALDVGN